MKGKLVKSDNEEWYVRYQANHLEKGFVTDEIQLHIVSYSPFLKENQEVEFDIIIIDMSVADMAPEYVAKIRDGNDEWEYPEYPEEETWNDIINKYNEYWSQEDNPLKLRYWLPKYYNVPTKK